MSPDRDKFPDERPDVPDPDVDAAFALIIAGWDDVPTLPDADPAPGGDDDPTANASPEPAGSDTPPARPQTAQPLPGPPPPGPPTPGPRDWAATEAVDEGFVPPDPPPLPRGDLTSQLAWAGVVLGPVFLLVCAFFWKDVGRLWLALAALAFIGGFVALVMRLPTSRDDSGDDGAVV